jgi:hypothetical protein
LLVELGRMQVFEVAFGGGEPTLHPDFLPILETAKNYGITPNFTTRELGWIDGPQGAQILGTIGAFAYSVHSAVDVENFVKKFPERWDCKHTVQHVVGTTSDAELDAILAVCLKHHVPITLLGFKHTGRGLAYRPKPSQWLDIVAGYVKNHLRVGVDTVLVQQAEAELRGVGVPGWCLTKKEGAFSCYIDAVEQKIGPSSFCAPEDYIHIPRLLENDIRGAFASF